MKRKNVSKKILVLCAVLCFAVILFSCTEAKDLSGNTINYQDIESVKVRPDSIADGFLISDFDISSVILEIKYKPDSATGRAMAEQQDKVAAENNTTVEEYNYLTYRSATKDMVKAEDIEKLNKTGKNTITLLYGKFTISFVLNLYDDRSETLHKVAFYDEDGTTLLSEVQYVRDGGRASQPALNAKSGYTFIGWRDMASGMLETFDNIKSDINFQAYYVADFYSVKYVVRYRHIEKNIEVYSKTKTGTGSETVIDTVSIPRGDNGANYYPNVPAIDGYVFAGWQTDIGEEKSSADEKFEEIYYAVFDKEKIAITFVFRPYINGKYSDKLVSQVEYFYADETVIPEPEGAHPAEKAGEELKPISEGNDYQFINWYMLHNNNKVVVSFPYTASTFTETCFYALYSDMNAGSEGLTYKIISESEKTCLISGYTGTDDIIVIPEKQVVDSVLCDVIGLEDGIFRNNEIKQFVVSSKNRYFTCKEGVLYSKAEDVLMVYPSHSTRNHYVIVGGVREISPYAFYRSKNLFSISLPETLLQIDDYAFAECALLETVTFPSDIRSIAEGAFHMSESSLKSIVFLGNQITALGDEAFYGLDKLTEINLPASVKSIGDGTFYGCSAVEKITAENSSYFTVYNGALYDIDYRNLYFYPAKYKENINGEIYIHPSCRKVLRGAFYNAEIGCITISSQILLETYSIVCPSLHAIRFDTSLISMDTSEFEQAFGGFLPQNLFVPKECTNFTDYESTILYYEPERWMGYNDYSLDGYLYATVNADGVLDDNGEFLTIIGYRGEEINLEPSYQLSGKRLISISPYAFYGNTQIKSVSIPVTVRSIGAYAFYGCTSLETVVLSQTDSAAISEIGDYAFFGCASLKTVRFVDSLSLEKFGKYVFDDTVFVDTIDEESDFLIVGGVLVRYHGTSATVNVPSAVTYIATDAFKDKGYITSVSLNSAKRLVCVDEYAFQNCIGLKEISFPASVNRIADYAFYGCSYLFSVKYAAEKENVDVGYYAYKAAGTFYNLPVYETFSDSEVHQIRFMASATEEYDLNGSAFVSPYELEDYEGIFLGWYFDDQIYKKRAVFPMYITEDTKLFARFETEDYNSDGIVFDLNDNDTYSVAAYTGTDSFVIVPETYKNIPVTGVKSDVFGSNVYDFSLPEDIDEIAENAFTRSGWYQSFAGDFVIYNDILIAYKGSAADVVVPSYVTMIANGAFRDNKTLKHVTLPTTINRIVRDLFNGCSSLETITIGSEVMSIEDSAFANCISLREVDFSNAISLTSVAYNAFENTKWLAEQNVDCLIIRNIFYRYFGDSDVLHLPNGIVSIAARAFYNNNKLKTVYFPTGLQSVFESAFENCGLTEVILPHEKCDLRFIMKRAFYNCYNISTFDFSLIKSLSEIEEEAFYNCTSLVQADFSSTLSLLGEYAFYGSGLKTVTFASGSTLDKIGNYAFSENILLKSVTFLGGSALNEVGDYAFNNCIALKAYNNAKAMTTRIGACAFYNCISMNELTINEFALKDIGVNAFWKVGNNVLATETNINMHIIGNILLEYNGSEQRVTIPENIVLIYNSAFAGNTHINEVVFASERNLQSINDMAFFGCTNLKTVSFPSSISFVGDNVMDGTAWYAEQLRSNDFIVIGNTLIKYNVSTLQEAVIPQNVSVINKNAFAGTSVYNIRMGENVTRIKRGAFDGILPAKWQEGEHEFSGYTLTMESPVPPLLEDDRPLASCCCIYVDTASILDTYRLNVNWRIQYDYKKDFLREIERYTITYKVDTQQGNPINKEAIHALYNAKDVTTFATAKEKYEFVGWFLDTSFNYAVTYPLVLTKDMTIYAKCVDYSVGSNPDKYFLEVDAQNNDMYTIKSYHDTVDKKVVIITEQSGKKISSISGYLGYIASGEGTDLYILNAKGEFEKYDRSIHGTKVQTYRPNTVIEEITFANNCTIETLGENCFAGMTSLKRITLPASLKQISQNAFSGCSSLEEIIFEDGISDMTICTNAFKNCESLVKITLPAGVTVLETDAFKGCYSLIDVRMEAEKPIQLDETNTPFEFNTELIITIPRGSYQSYSSAWERYQDKLQEKKETEENE